MHQSIIDTIIIGAGLSGLTAAKKMTNLGLGPVVVLEKSRGIGGRMATRRTLETRFDHGAQFYRVKADITEFHQAWKKGELSHQWFVSSKGDHWCAHSGMTSLAKDIANNLDVQLEKKIQSLRYNSEQKLWSIHSESGQEWYCRQLVLSAPLPQALQLLEKSNLSSEIEPTKLSELQKISYTKALIALITLKDDLNFNENGYQEFTSGPYFSISDQKKKGVSSIPAITLTMSAEFSETHFDRPDESNLEKIVKNFQASYPQTVITGMELKKWRYCQTTSTFKSLFLEVIPGLYLIGDAFGGPSLLGAIRSAEALTEEFLDL